MNITPLDLLQIIIVIEFAVGAFLYRFDLNHKYLKNYIKFSWIVTLLLVSICIYTLFKK